MSPRTRFLQMINSICICRLFSADIAPLLCSAIKTCFSVLSSAAEFTYFHLSKFSTYFNPLHSLTFDTCACPWPIATFLHVRNSHQTHHDKMISFRAVTAIATTTFSAQCSCSLRELSASNNNRIVCSISFRLFDFD